MISIEKKELELFLNSKKSSIERPIISGIGEIVSGISMFLTLCTSQFKNIPIVGTIYFQIVMYIIAIVITVMGVYNLIGSFQSRQTIKNFYDSICELDINRVHTVNIVLIRNTPQKGKYLLIKNKAWKCELFPSYNVKEETYDVSNETELIKKAILRDFGINDFSLRYLKPMEKHIKICAGTNTPFRYKFHFYRVDITETNSKLNRRFNYNGNTYVWKSLDQMHKNKNIMTKNADVVKYVADLESIPYN